MKLGSLLLLLICFSVLNAQTSDESLEVPEPADTTEVTSVLLQRVLTELAEVETQIAREEERLALIMTELVMLRRNHAMFANAESAFLLGEELYSTGSIVWARDAFESIVDNFPNSIYYLEALFRLELIAFELQDYEGAVEYFHALIEIDPAFKFVDLAYIAAGLATYSQGDFAGSRVLYNYIAPSSEYYTLAEYLKAVAFVEEGSIDAAKTTLEGIISSTGASSGDTDLADRARIALAQILVDQEEDYESALEYYSRVSPFSTYYDIAMIGKVWTLMRLEKYQEAYNFAEIIMKEIPNSELISEFELAQANCALGAEDLETAISMYRDLLAEYSETADNYDLFLSGSSLTQEEFSLERERLDRIRLGLVELKEEAFTQGDMDLVDMITNEEESLRELFSEISYLETILSLPVEMDTEDLEHQLSVLIQKSRSETEILALAAGEIHSMTEVMGTEEDRQDLIVVENELERIRLSLQDLASKFEGGMTAQHDWVLETQYGIAVATFMERELKRDSVTYLGAYYRNRIQEALEEGDSLEAASLDSLRSREISAINRRIDDSAIVCAGYFEDYLASYPDSRFIADILVRLAQLYYDIDNLLQSERQAAAGIEEYVPEDYSRSIELYQTILTEHSGSAVEDIALYSMGYCLESMMDFEGAVENYRTLLQDYPRSDLAGECNIRVGNFYFDILEYDSALVYFQNILEYPNCSPNLFQHGLYKLGWTQYLIKDFRNSISTFAYLLQDDQTIDSLGISRRGDIRILNEAREYMAYDFLELNNMSPTGIHAAVSFLSEFGDSVTTAIVISKMAEISGEMSIWDTSIEAYEALLAEMPYSPDAPVYQLRIAQAYEELGDYALAANARDQLVSNYGENSDWYLNVGDESVLALTDSLRGTSFEEAIQYYLEQTVATKNDPVAFTQVNYALIERIESYIQQYSASPKKYEYQFYLGDAFYHTEQYIKAGDVYFEVALDSSSFLRQEDALNNAFSSYLIAYEQVSGVDSLALRENLRETVLAYTDLYPNGENAAFFLWAAAPKFYNAGEYDTCREMFSMIFDNYSHSGYEARSAKFIADSYQQEEMYADAEAWYGLAARAATLSGEDLGADIEALAASSAYNDAASLAESENTEDLIAAAARWEQTAHEHAGTDVAPVALYDAAETYGKAGSINDAVRLFQELAVTYPSYENAPNGLLRAAYLLREDGLFVRGAQLYLEAYNSFPGAPDMNSALASAAKCYEDGDRQDLAVGVFQQIVTDGVGTAGTIMEAYAKIGEYNYNLRNFSVARSNFENCMLIYDQYNDGRIKYPALSAFLFGEMSAVDYYTLVPVNPENVEYKTQLFNGAVANYNRTFTYLDDDYVFRAVLKIGQLQEDFASAVGFMDAPAGLTPEGEEDFYNALMEIYDTYIQRALSTYENGLQLAVSNGIKTEFTHNIAANLDLLLPGASANLGYSPAITVYADTTAAVDSAGIVESGFTPDAGDDTDESGTTDETEFPDSDYSVTPAIEPVTDDDSGGGCFLWPF